jgi:lysophosphatidylcholine acyltransferase/lyso-PAF acetyltransferase
VQIGIFNHVSYMDAFVVVWAFCAAGVTMHYTQFLPILGPGIRALQNLYLPKEGDKAKQQSSMVEMIRQR